MLRILVKLEGVAFFLTLFILATFIHLRMPYFSLITPTLPEAKAWFTHTWFQVGTYTTNLQLLVVMACILLFDTPLATLTLLLYLLLGFLGFPIFYQGGGLAYLKQPTTGYLISLLPATWFCGLLLRRHPRRQPLPGPYILAATLTLVMIHVIGGIYAAIYFQMVPIQYLASYSLPQLPWQIAWVCLLALLVYALNRHLFKHTKTSKYKT